MVSSLCNNLQTGAVAIYKFTSQGAQKSFERRNYPLLLTGIGERHNQTIIKLRKCSSFVTMWTPPLNESAELISSVGPLVNSLLWDIQTVLYITVGDLMLITAPVPLLKWQYVVDMKTPERLTCRRPQCLLLLCRSLLQHSRRSAPILHCKKRSGVFRSPAGMSLSKLSLAGNN